MPLYIRLKLILFLFVLFVVSAISCKSPGTVTIPENFKGFLYANEWKVIGPFTYDTLKQEANSTFYNKDLERFGIDENDFSEDTFDKLTDTAYQPKTVKEYKSPIPFLHYIKDRKVTDKSNFYLFTTIYSQTEQEIVIILDGTRSYKVWLNKKVIIEVLNKSSAAKIGDRFVRVKLVKGKNTVFAKVNKGSNLYSWKLSMALASGDAARKIYRENYLTDFVSTPLITDSVQLYLGPYSKGKLIIKDGSGVKFKSDVANNGTLPNTISCRNLPPGLYQSLLILGKDTLTETIYKGDILSYISQLKATSGSIKCDKGTQNDIEAVIERLNFLIEKSDFASESSRKYYGRNLLYNTTILKDLLTYSQTHKEDKLFPGNSLKTYSSQEDASKNHFLLHVNKKLIGKKPFSLILFVPYALTDTTMTRSWYLGNLDQMEMDTKMADDYGFAVAWLFLKGHRYTEQNALNDTKAVIERIKQDYNLDETNIYLVGECQGGKRALLLGESSPGLFAGMALSSPNTEEPNRLIPSLWKLKKMPLCIQHGIDDDVISVKSSEEFVNKARKAGIQVKFLKTNTGHITISRDERRYAFSFFDSVRNVQMNGACFSKSSPK